MGGLCRGLKAETMGTLILYYRVFAHVTLKHRDIFQVLGWRKQRTCFTIANGVWQNLSEKTRPEDGGQWGRDTYWQEKESGGGRCPRVSTRGTLAQPDGHALPLIGRVSRVMSARDIFTNSQGVKCGVTPTYHDWCATRRTGIETAWGELGHPIHH